MSSHDISFVIKTVVAKKYKISCSRPFYKSPLTPISIFWEKCMSFVNECEGRAIILLLEAEDLLHWSVLNSATDLRFYLADSDSRKVLNRKDCSTIKNEHQKGIFLKPSLAFFISRKNQNPYLLNLCFRKKRFKIQPKSQ